jgi:hypothetical protein
MRFHPGRSALEGIAAASAGLAGVACAPGRPSPLTWDPVSCCGRQVIGKETRRSSSRAAIRADGL